MNMPGLLPVNIGSSDPYPVNFWSPRKTPKVSAPISGNADTGGQYDPFGAPIGPQVGDLMSLLASYAPQPSVVPPTFGGPADPITGAQSSGAIPTAIQAPSVRPHMAPTVSAGEDSLGTLQPGGPNNSIPDTFYPQFDFSNWNPSFSPPMPGNVSVGEESLGTLQPGGPQNVQSGGDPFSTGDPNWLLKLGVGLGSSFIPGGNIANMAYNAYDSGQANYEAARKGVLPPDWNSSILHDLFSPASWLGGRIGTALGQDAGYYDNAPILSNAASATTLGDISGLDTLGPNAIMNGAYGQSAAGDKQQMGISALQNGTATLPSGATFDNTQMGYTGQPFYNMGGADLFNMIGANRLSWQDRGGAENMPNYGPSVDDLNRWNALNSTGNRWDN